MPEFPAIASKPTGRPRRHQSNRERVAEQRRRDKEKRLAMLNQLFAWQQNRQDAFEESCDLEKMANDRAKRSIDSITSFGTSAPEISDLFLSDFTDFQCAGTMYTGTNVSMPLCYVRWIGVEPFVQILRLLHRRQIGNKDRNYPISPALFDPDLVTSTVSGTRKQNLFCAQCMAGFREQ